MSLDSTAVGAITGVLSELHAKPDEIENVQTALNHIMTTLDNDPFQYMATIQEDSFGGITTATTLAYHHGLAQQVMNETLDGIKKDIEAFATNLKKAHEIVNEADDSSAADIKKRSVLVNALDHLNSHSSEAHAHNQARNHQHGPWGTSGASPGSGSDGQSS